MVVMVTVKHTFRIKPEWGLWEDMEQFGPTRCPSPEEPEDRSGSGFAGRTCTRAARLPRWVQAWNREQRPTRGD